MLEKVAILGASDNPERYSYKAFHLLKQYGHTPFLINNSVQKIDDFPTYSQLSDIKDKLDTLTMYVNPRISSKLQDEILNSRPRRVIFNPGTENPELEAALNKQGCHVLRACTLVLLSTQQFEVA